MTTLPHMPDRSAIKWKPGAVNKAGDSALGLAFVDSRDVYDALDQAGVAWSSHVLNIVAVGQTVHATVSLIVDGTERTDVGSGEDAPTAFAQAVKRAAAQHGLFRGLYDLGATWAEYDAQRKQFTPAGLAKLRQSLSTRVDNSTPAPPAGSPKVAPDTLKKIRQLGGDKWLEREAKAAQWASNGRTQELAALSENEALSIYLQISQAQAATL